MNLDTACGWLSGSQACWGGYVLMRTASLIVCLEHLEVLM